MTPPAKLLGEKLAPPGALNSAKFSVQLASPQAPPSLPPM